MLRVRRSVDSTPGVSGQDLGLKLERKEENLELELTEPRTQYPWREGRRRGEKRARAAPAGSGRAWVLGGNSSQSRKESACRQSSPLFKGQVNVENSMQSEAQRLWHKLKVRHSPSDVAYSILPLVDLMVLTCTRAWRPLLPRGFCEH